nr:uncharacterized protein LOC118879591 [Drosophila suzukii]
MMDQLRKAQADEGIAEGKIKTIIQNVDTRWNSCQDIMESFLGLANKVAVILINKLERVKGLPEMLNALELNICRDLCRLFQPYKTATEQINGEQYVTASLVIPLISLLANRTNKSSLDTDKGNRDKEALVKIFEKRFQTFQQQFECPRKKDVEKQEDFDDFMSSHNYSTQRDMHDDNKENKELKLYFSLRYGNLINQPFQAFINSP